MGLGLGACIYLYIYVYILYVPITLEFATEEDIKKRERIELIVMVLNVEYY